MATVDLVALGVGATRLGLVVRHRDVDMEAVALVARHVHLLEPDRRPAAVGIDQVLGSVLLVAQHGAPERLHLGADVRVDRDLDGLHGARVGRQVHLARGGGD